MAKTNKRFLIKGLKRKGDLESSSKILLDDKMKNVFLMVDKFLENDSEKNLHQLRIALRRFRYMLESLYLCVDDALFTSVLKKTKDLLDHLGAGRDQDVLAARFEAIASEHKIKDSKTILALLNNQRDDIRQTIKRELIKYICDNNVNKFFRKNKLG